MNKTYELRVYDSLEYLPSNCWKKESIVDFEKTFAVKWYIIFAYDGESIIGSLRILRNPDDISNWYICEVHTLEQYRRIGIATKMYTVAFNLIKEYFAASSITVSISASNKASICLHNKLGFRNTSNVSMFADFCFEADETMYSLWLAQCYPAKNTPVHLDLLRPMWINYMNEIEEHDSEEELVNGLQTRIRLSENQEQIFFEKDKCFWVEVADCEAFEQHKNMSVLDGFEKRNGVYARPLMYFVGGDMDGLIRIPPYMSGLNPINRRINDLAYWGEINPKDIQIICRDVDPTDPMHKSFCEWKARV